VETKLRALAEPARVPALQRFFKTGPGSYGEGDRFLGVRVPAIRKLSKQLRGLPLQEALALLESPFHEARLLALLVLIETFRQGDEETRTKVYEAYLANTARINGWDLVDVSAEHIVGAYLQGRDRGVLVRLARSRLIWDRRIAILATHHFIRRGEVKETFKIARILLQDDEDLIQKAVGWMLREVGKRDRQAEEAFLARHYRKMPRTMLRYAIERFEPTRRRAYLEGRA
jgi:3-methyladenine DNA glycosylase AlkD